MKFDGKFYDILEAVVNDIDGGQMAQLLNEDIQTQEKIIILS